MRIPGLHAGIDENGLGPRMGPLVVTGVWVRTGRSGWDPDVLREALAGPFDVRDSKKVFKQTGLARGEEAALALLGALGGSIPGSAGTLLAMLGADHGDAGRPCAGGSAPSLCGGPHMALPLWCDPGKPPPAARELAAALGLHGIKEAGVACEVLCARDLNSRLAGGLGKLDVDLDLMMSVAHRIRGSVAGDVEFTCGKVGARKRYSAGLPPGAQAVSEEAGRSAYLVPGLGRVDFVVDADDSEPLVSMASVIGKYVREVVMESIHRFVSGLVPMGRRPSGYRDPVTAGYLDRARSFLREAGVPEVCVERSR